MELRNNLFSKKKPTIDTEEKKRLKHKLFAFFICLLISFSLWLLISYSQMTVSYFTFPVVASTPPSGYILIDQSARNVSFQTHSSAQAAENIRKHGNKNQVAIKLSDFEPILSGNQYTISVNIEQYLREVLRQSGYNGSVENVAPDSITFILETGLRKEVTVKENIRFSIPDQHRQFSPLTVYPEKVFIEGRRNIIDTIQFVPTELINLGPLYDSINMMVPLKTYRFTHVSPDSVRIRILAGEVTEKQLPVIITENHPDTTISMKFIPEQVIISALVPVSRFQEITPEQFVVEPVYDTTTFSNSNMLYLRVSKHPEHTQIIRINPETVNFIIEDKNQ